MKKCLCLEKYSITLGIEEEEAGGWRLGG